MDLRLVFPKEPWRSIAVFLRNVLLLLVLSSYLEKIIRFWIMFQSVHLYKKLAVDQLLPSELQHITAMLSLNDFELYKNNSLGLHNNYRYRYALPFEKVDDPIQKTLVFQDNWHHSITISVGYFLLIKLIQCFMKNRTPFNLRWPLFIWNLSLALFSICGLIRFSEDLIHSLLYEGVYPSFCYSVHPNDVAAYWACLYFFSKIVELGDTLFIVLKKKPLIFLHYYHHAAVLIYAAHSGAEHTGSGRAFISMNFLAHSAMYTYFAIASYGIRPPKAVSMALTTIQTAQMFAGIAISAYVYRIKTETNLPCQQSMKNLLLGCVLYITFAALFVQYFINNYLSTKSKEKVKSQ